MNKPSIVRVIGKHVELQKSGREYIGLCPFHADKRPSFSVNEDKGFFHCFGCGEGGDVIRFVQLTEQTDFKGALKILGIDGGEFKPAPVNTHRRKAATLLADWLNRQHLLIGARCRGLSQQIALADSIPDRELSERFNREWEILGDLHEDLQNPQYATELWQAREAIEGIPQCTDPEPLPEFPSLTPEYREYLKAAVRGELC